MPNTVTRFLIRHALALAGTMVIMTLFPCVAYFTFGLMTNDIGGPMMIILVPLLSAVVAIIFTSIFLLPAMTVLQWARAKCKDSPWFWLLPALFLLAGSRLLLIPIGGNDHGDMVLSTLRVAYVAVGLLCYALFLALRASVVCFLQYAAIIRRFGQS